MHHSRRLYSVRQMIGVIALIVAMVASLAATAAEIEPRNVMFGNLGVTVSDTRPGTRIAWLGVGRLRVGDANRVKRTRGSVVAQPDGRVTIEVKRADEVNALWLFGNVDTASISYVPSPSYSASAEPLTISLRAGEEVFAVRAAEIDLIYVRPRTGAWTLRAIDGGVADADRQRNGLITVALSTMQPLHGGSPPVMTASTDRIGVVDPIWMRVVIAEVKP